MAKFLSPTSSKWSKCFRVMYKRYFSCDLKDKLIQAPQCKGRRIPKEHNKCQPLEGSCYAVMGVCPKTSIPECSEIDIKPVPHLSCCADKRLTEEPCDKPVKRVEKKEEEKPFVSMWETCGIEKECPDFVDRCDEIYYKSTDKTKRIYTRTWENCEPVVVKKKVCCFAEMSPPVYKRSKEECPQSAKEQNSEQFKENYSFLKECLQQNVKPKGKGKCHKTTMPCCRKVAKDLRCRKFAHKSDCLKQCCPHPSFSECDLPEIKKALPSECRCSHFESRCEAERYWNRKEFFNLPPALPAWPPKERPK